MPSYRELKDKIRVLEEENKTLREECGVHSSNRIHLEGKIMEWQSYAEYKKEMLVATMQERRRKLQIIFWSFIWNAFKGTIFCWKKALHHGFALASKCIMNIYYLRKPTLVCWKGILGRPQVTPWTMTILRPPWLSLFRLCSLKLLSTVYKTVI